MSFRSIVTSSTVEAKVLDDACLSTVASNVEVKSVLGSQIYS